MICSGQDTHLAAVKKKKRRFLCLHSRPSPALCCACGLCIMLAGINITLVGAFSFAKLLPSNNPLIIIGPLLLLVALSLFGVCCMCSRQPAAHPSHAAAGQDHWSLMRMGGTAFEMEASEHTLQDTTATQLSPTNSLCSSHRCSSTHLPVIMLHPSAIVNSPNGSHSSCPSSPREDDTSPLSPSHDERDV